MSPRPVLAAVLVLAFAASAPAQKIDNQPQNKLGEKLAKRISLDNAQEMKFGEAIKFLAEKYDLPLVVDSSVGQQEGMAACDADDRLVKLPKLLNVRMDTVLRLLCEQVSAVPLVQPDHIKITDAVRGLYESGVLPQPDKTLPEEDPALLDVTNMQKSKPLIKRALVSGAFKNVTLADILDDIAESTGATVVLSPAAGDAAKKTLTVRFSNTPVDAAVRTLCEMADVGVIEDANVLTVTSHERAEQKKIELTERRKAKLAEAGVGGGGAVLVGGGGVVPIDLTAELSRLKDQNEMLKKQLDEIQKLLKK